MSRFTAPLIVTPLGDGKNWQIIYSTEGNDRFAYEIGKEGSGLMVKPPANFVTDFASVPRLFWWLLPRWGRYGNAAVIHDFLYRDGHLIRIEPPRITKPTRKRADEIFLEGMIVLRVKPWKRQMIYWGVRIGGWYPWWQNRRAK